MVRTEAGLVDRPDSRPSSTSRRRSHRSCRSWSPSTRRTWRSLEPSLADGDQGLINQPVLWIVRVLESERVVTYIVVDGTDAIYEMTPDGEAILVGGDTTDAGATPRTLAT